MNSVWISFVLMGQSVRCGSNISWTKLILSCMVLQSARSCYWDDSPTALPTMLPNSSPSIPSLANDNDRPPCGINFTDVPGTNDVVEVRFTFIRHNTAGKKSVSGGDQCMCLEDFTDGQNERFEVELYDGNCYPSPDNCPDHPATVTCNCTMFSCLCDDDGNTTKSDISSDMERCTLTLPGGNLTHYISRTCFHLGDNEQRKRRAAEVSNVTSWIFCICNVSSQSAYICECPDTSTGPSNFTTHRPSTTTTITTLYTATASLPDTKTQTNTYLPTNPHMETQVSTTEPDDQSSGENSGELNLGYGKQFSVKCSLSSTPSTTILFTTNVESHGSQTKWPRAIIWITLAAIAFVLMAIMGVVLICRCRNTSKVSTKYSLNHNEQAQIGSTVTSNLHSNSYQNLDSDRHDRQNHSSQVGLSPGPAYEDPNAISYQNQLHLNIPSNSDGPVPYEQVELSNREYSDDPTPYASTDVPEGHASHHQSSDATAYSSTSLSNVLPQGATSTMAANRPLDGAPFPPYAKVQKNKPVQQQASFEVTPEIERHVADGMQQHEYGQLQHPVLSDDGTYHQLERKLNKQIVDSAR